MPEWLCLPGVILVYHQTLSGVLMLFSETNAQFAFSSYFYDYFCVLSQMQQGKRSALKIGAILSVCYTTLIWEVHRRGLKAAIRLA